LTLSPAGRRRIVVIGDVINDVLVKPTEAITPDSDTAAMISVRRRCSPGGSAPATPITTGGN